MKVNAKGLIIAAIAVFLATAMLIPVLSLTRAEPFTQSRLDELNRSGKPVLLAIHADWCSTCKTQERVLQELLPQSEFKRISLLRMDFDLQKDAVRAFGVEYQSTLIAFKEGHEVGRSTADQSPIRIAELLRLSL